MRMLFCKKKQTISNQDLLGELTHQSYRQMLIGGAGGGKVVFFFFVQDQHKFNEAQITGLSIITRSLDFHFNLISFLTCFSDEFES